MKQSLLRTTAVIGLSFLAISVPNPAQANPEGGQVVGGSATISENGKKLDVHQYSDRAVIDWRSFNIEIDEHTEFHQPSSSATALNRINDVNPSRIAGKLSANGNIILVNPNGVFFEGSSRVDVNGIVATTANIRPEDFMAGSNEFHIPGNPDAAIINEGIITAKEAGLAGLVAPNVENHGIIQARMGRVQLASGDTVTVDFYGDDLLKVAVKDENLKSQFVGNTGVLSADGGTVAMTAAAAKQTVNSLIVAEGLIEAKTIGRDDSGAIIIGGEGSNKTEKSGNAYVAVSGYLDASGRNEGEQGGTVEVLGDHIAITETAFLDTSGHRAIIPERKPNSGTATMREDKSIDNGVRTEEDFLAQDSRAGGSIKIGGDYLGKGDTQTAKTVKVADGALILNNAIESGDGGRTIVWSDDTTEFSGLVISTGGAKGGHGGFLETSGKINLKADGFADLSAQDGFSKGTYLLDPDTITIYGNVDPAFVDRLGDGMDDDLQLWLDGNDIDGDGTAEGTGEDGILSGVGSCGSAITCVETWANKGVGVDFTQTTPSNRPEFVADGRNGNDILRYGTSDEVRIAGNLNGLGDGFTMFAAADRIDWGDTTFSSLLRSEDFGNNRGFYFGDTSSSFSDEISVRVGGNSGNAQSAKYRDASINDPTIFAATYNATGSNKEIFQNGFSEDSNGGTTGVFDDTSGDTSVGRGFTGDYFEAIIFSETLSNQERHLIEQYQAAKWDIALTAPGTATPPADLNAERIAATAYNPGDPNEGFNVFTTDYLERLAGSADVHLRAASAVTLDLQGDTLDFSTGAAAGKSLTLQTDNGDITDASAGTIRTTRTGGGANQTGGITFIAGGAGNINIDTTVLDAQNDGIVSLTAGGGITTTTVSGGQVIMSAGAAINAGSTLTSTNAQIDLDADTGINVTGAITAATTFDADNATSGNIVTGSTINAAGEIAINNIGGNIDASGNLRSTSGGIDLDAAGTITLTGGARADNSAGIDINAQNDALNSTIFLQGTFQTASNRNITLHDNAQIVAGTLTLRTNTLIAERIDANGRTLEFRTRDHMFNQGADSIFNGTNGPANNLYIRGYADNDYMVIGSDTGIGQSYMSAADLNAIDLDSFDLIRIGNNNQRDIIRLEGNFSADADIEVLALHGSGAGAIELNGSITSTKTDGNVTISATNVDIGGDVIADTGTSNNIDITALGNNITISGTDVLVNAGSGSVSFSTGGGDEITTNDQLTVTAGDLTSDDNFNGDLTWRVSGDPTASLVNGNTGNLTIEQATAADSIDIGSTTGSGDIGLSSALLTHLSNKFGDWTIGRSDGGAVTNYATAVVDNISILSGSSFTNEAALDMGGQTLNVNTTGDIILNQDMTSSATGNAIVLSTADDFINNAGSDALNASNASGRWLVYSDDPVGNQNNGLLPGESLYGQANVATALSNATANTNAFAYLTATRPTIIYDVDDLSVEYGEALGALSVTYNSGLVGDDIITAIGESNAPTLSSNYTVGRDADTYAGDITGVTGALTNVLGYQYAFNAGDLEVTQADLNISVDPAFESINQGAPLPSYNLSYGPFKLADTFADLDVLPTITVPSNNLVGSFPVTLSGGSDNNYNYIFTNGALEILAFIATNNAVTIPPSVEQDFSTRILGSRFNNQEFNIPAFEASSLPDSQIDIEIEGVSDEQPELNPTEEKKRIIKLRIDKDLATQLNLQINDGVL